MKTPDQALGQPEKSKRPKSWDIQDKFEIYKRAEDDRRGGGKYIIDEIKNYINGDGDDETREQYYPNWIKEDFERLLQLIEKENE